MSARCKSKALVVEQASDTTAKTHILNNTSTFRSTICENWVLGNATPAPSRSSIQRKKGHSKNQYSANFVMFA